MTLTSNHKKWVDDYEMEESKVDMSKYSKSEGDDLKAADHIGKLFKLVIADISIRDYPATDKQAANSKPVLSFEKTDKALVVNATNTKLLCEAYGDDSEGWKGHEIGLSVADYTDKGYGHGWVVKALDIPEPEFDDSIPFSQVAA